MSLIDIDWNPNREKLRQFAWIWMIGFGVVGLVLAWKWDWLSWQIPSILWIIAVVVGLPGLLFPLVVKPVYKLWMAVTFPIGWILSHTVLGLIYFGLFTLVGVVFRMIGRDPLARRKAAAKDSYWIDRTAKSSNKRYFQQF